MAAKAKKHESDSLSGRNIQLEVVVMKDNSINSVSELKEDGFPKNLLVKEIAGLYIVLYIKKIKLILFKLDNVRSGCPISRARGSRIKCSSIPD